MKNEFKIRQRKGRNIEVCFDYEPTKWISTGTTDKIKAFLFIENKKRNKNEIKNEITFLDFYKLVEKDNFKMLQDYDQNHKKEKREIYYKNIISLYKNYILPTFGNCIISKLSFTELNNKLALMSVKNLTKNRIIQALKVIYKICTLQNITDVNLAENLESYNYDKKEKEIFTKEELIKLFSNDKNYFSSPKWKLYFMFLRDLGWRPSEVLSLKYTDINDNGGVSTDTSIIYNGSKLELQNKIKTTNKGQSYKIGVLSKETLTLFNQLNKNNDALIFLFNGKSPYSMQANRELEKALNKANIKAENITQYSFRHTFNTTNYYLLDKDTRLELMGHTHERTEYLHLTKEERLKHLMNDVKTLKILGA